MCAYVCNVTRSPRPKFTGTHVYTNCKGTQETLRSSCSPLNVPGAGAIFPVASHSGASGIIQIFQAWKRRERAGIHPCKSSPKGSSFTPFSVGQRRKSPAEQNKRWQLLLSVESQRSLVCAVIYNKPTTRLRARTLYFFFFFYLVCKFRHSQFFDSKQPKKKPNQSFCECGTNGESIKLDLAFFFPWDELDSGFIICEVLLSLFILPLKTCPY